jgi:hypothetical protein
MSAKVDIEFTLNGIATRAKVPADMSALDMLREVQRLTGTPSTMIVHAPHSPSPQPVHVPAHNTPIKPGRREALLIAIAKAREWMEDLAHGRVASFVAIARREGKAERHIRLLAPLAFLSPRIVSALLDGAVPADLTLTQLARGLPYSWIEQEGRIDLRDQF